MPVSRTEKDQFYSLTLFFPSRHPDEDFARIRELGGVAHEVHQDLFQSERDRLK